ncbi:MAG: hypothetical protein K6G58_05620 [Lachnospiraceae bacterium]|nr:hypothetical protein [Lachnospiraceae bacterium]
MNKETDMNVPSLSLAGLSKIVIPSVLVYMMIAMYGVVDSFLIARLVNSTAIAATNIFLPIGALFTGLGYMIGTGANAAIMELHGKGSHDLAGRLCSGILTYALVISLVCPALIYIFRGQVLGFFGMTPGNEAYVLEYFNILILFMPALLISCVLNLLLIGQEAVMTVALLELCGGLTNCILDVVLMKHFGLGISGAAAAAGTGYLLQTVLAVILIARRRLFGFSPGFIPIKEITPVFFNGISELLSMTSAGILTIMLNRAAADFYSSVGTSVVCVVSNVTYLSDSLFIGIMVVVEPMIAYFYGRDNRDEIRSICKKTITLICILTAVTVLSAVLAARPLSDAYFHPDKEGAALCTRALLFAGASFLFSGFGIFVSGYFTGCTDGKTSGLFSVLRNIVFCMFFLAVLTGIFGGIGIWASIVATQLSSAILGFFLIKRQGYLLKISHLV